MYIVLAVEWETISFSFFLLHSGIQWFQNNNDDDDDDDAGCIKYFHSFYFHSDFNGRYMHMSSSVMCAVLCWDVFEVQIKEIETICLLFSLVPIYEHLMSVLLCSVGFYLMWDSGCSPFQVYFLYIIPLTPIRLSWVHDLYFCMEYNVVIPNYDKNDHDICHIRGWWRWWWVADDDDDDGEAFLMTGRTCRFAIYSISRWKRTQHIESLLQLL